jgi:heme-degrading monooxygenase HmoA
MFVIISHLPTIKEGKEAEFLEWFASATREFSGMTGLISWRLLKPVAGGNYTALIEHESQETFLAMRNTPIHADVAKRLAPLLDGPPSPQLYEVFVG